MTSPEDNSLEEALRRALSNAASEVEPGTDGLDKIRARIGNRPPRPWLFSVLAGLAGRVRHWPWRGHWAWQDSLPRLAALQERRSRRGNFQGPGIGWLRYVTVLAGIAVLASIALGVQPFRHAILQASSSLDGGGGSPGGGAGTEGGGTQASAGGGTQSAGTVAAGSGQASQSGAAAAAKSPTSGPRPTSSARCVSTALPVVTDAKPSQASVAPVASGTASASSATPAQPVYSNRNVPTCPVSAPARTPTPRPARSSSSPVPTPSDVPSTQAAPTGTGLPPSDTPTASTTPTPTPTPTSAAHGSSPTGHDSPPTGHDSRPTGHTLSSGPSGSPSSSWQQRQEKRHADLRDWRYRRR
jgi:hypothetical protein